MLKDNREMRARPWRARKPDAQPVAKNPDSILNALRWLARHQNPDGSWSPHLTCARCNSESQAPKGGVDSFTEGVTGLALLAFLRAGHTPYSKEAPFADVVKKGLQFLMKRQDSTGRIGNEDVAKFMYNHMLAAGALVEAFRLTGSIVVEDPARRAIEYMLAAQSSGSGWHYGFRSGESDSSMTAWGLQALLAAEKADFQIPAEAFKGIVAWYDGATDRSDGYVGYQSNQGHYIAGLRCKSERVFWRCRPFTHDVSPTTTAMGVVSRLHLDKKRDPRLVQKSIDLIMKVLPEWDPKELKVDMVYAYFGSLAILMADGPLGEKWSRWKAAVERAVADKQIRSQGECRFGSWEPVDPWACEGGRVYMTAMGALALQIIESGSRIPAQK